MKREQEMKKSTKLPFEKGRNGKYPELWEGAKVYLSSMYGSGAKYFAAYLDNDFVLIADTKKDAKDGFGYIYKVYDIIAFCE